MNVEYHNVPYFLGDYQFFRDKDNQLWRRKVKYKGNFSYRGEWKKIKG